MEKKKSILTSSLIASAIVTCTSFATSATEVFHRNNLGSSTEIRTNLSEKSANSLELTCGTKSDSVKRKDGKCGKKMKKDGKCGKMKDGKCGEGKCGAKHKKKVDTQ